MSININDVFIQIISFDSLFEVKKLDYYSLLICYNYMKKKERIIISKVFVFMMIETESKKMYTKKLMKKKKKV